MFIKWHIDNCCGFDSFGLISDDSKRIKGSLTGNQGESSIGCEGLRRWLRIEETKNFEDNQQNNPTFKRYNEQRSTNSKIHGKGGQVQHQMWQNTYDDSRS